MKKVTASFLHLGICLVLFALFFGETFYTKNLSAWVQPPHVFPLLLMLYFLCGLWFAFVPTWAYGVQGIEIYRFAGRFPTKFDWIDITDSYLAVSSKGGFATWILKMKDGSKISMSCSQTRNCSKVVQDVIRFIQIENPAVVIPEDVLEILKGRL